MKKYEHDKITVEEYDVEDVLEIYGAEGWELVHALPSLRNGWGFYGYDLFFKCELEE